MENKQIIIDGVDVSGCEYYNKDDNTCREVNGNYNTDICEFDKCENSNCRFKQLKRKEQECEELKEKYKWYDHYKEQALYNKNLCNEKSEQLDQLKAENDQLKRQHQGDKGLITSAGKMNYQLIQEYDKLKNCLAEIKEIAKENIRIADLEGLNGVYRRGLATQILQKISEMENDNA